MQSKLGFNEDSASKDMSLWRLLRTLDSSAVMDSVKIGHVTSIEIVKLWTHKWLNASRVTVAVDQILELITEQVCGTFDELVALYC